MRLSASTQLFAVFLSCLPLSLALARGTSAREGTVLENIPENICETSFRTVKGDVGGAALKVFKQPNYYADDRGAEILGTIPVGTEVLFNLSDRTGDWAEISQPGGSTGWVRTRGLMPSPDGAAEFSGQMRVKTLENSTLSLRRSPSLSAPIIAEVRSGEHVVYKGFEGYWSEIIAQNGMRGFVSSQYLVCADSMETPKYEN